MPRISLDPPRTLLVRISEWYSRRQFGKVADPMRAAGHHPRVLVTMSRLEMSVGRWKALDPTLKQFAVMASATRLGCSWCLDFGYWESVTSGASGERLRYVPVWQDHREKFSDLELRVMEYATAMTETEPTVTDEMTEPLIAELGEKAFVELTAMVAVENMRARINDALGLVGQGFSDACEIPPLPR